MTMEQLHPSVDELDDEGEEDLQESAPVLAWPPLRRVQYLDIRSSEQEREYEARQSIRQRTLAMRPVAGEHVTRKARSVRSMRAVMTLLRDRDDTLLALRSEDFYDTDSARADMRHLISIAKSLRIVLVEDEQEKRVSWWLIAPRIGVVLLGPRSYASQGKDLALRDAARAKRLLSRLKVGSQDLNCDGE